MLGPEWGKPIRNGREKHDQVLAVGGLHVYGTERHEARRIHNQLRDISGYQGDPGIIASTWPWITLSLGVSVGNVSRVFYHGPTGWKTPINNESINRMILNLLIEG